MKKTILISFSVVMALVSCKQTPKTLDTTNTQDTTTAAPEPPAAPQTDTANANDTAEKEQMAVITTPAGQIVVKLYNETPQHRDNFIKLVKDGFYNNLLFHRVMKHFMIQGGDPNSKNAKPGQQLGDGDVGYTIPAEINKKLIHKKGALAAARMGDQINPAKRSSGCQFYIVHGDITDPGDLQNLARTKGFQYTPEQLAAYAKAGGAPALDGDYTVFGEVVSGINVVDVIAGQPGDQFNRPFSDIRFSIKMKE